MTLLAQTYRRLKGQTAWIIGGKRIGQTVARALAQQSVHLLINYHRFKKEAEAAAASARRWGVRAQVVHSDASDRTSVAAAIRSFRRHFPRVDLLINMASVFDEISLEKISRQDWERNLNAHLLGSFWPT